MQGKGRLLAASLGGNRRSQLARQPAGGLSLTRILSLEPRPSGRGDPKASIAGIADPNWRGHQQVAFLLGSNPLRGASSLGAGRLRGRQATTLR
jgi:hypothetical protein